MLKVKLFRLATRVMGFLFWRRLPPDNLAIHDRLAPTRDGEIKVRIYTPELPGTYPAIVYYHGGGFVLGDLGAIDGACRSLASATSHIVVSVDYRLAPEAPFPAAAHDCIDALKWVFANAGELDIDASRIFVAGDSAGGNLAAVTALHARRDNGEMIKGQVLIYPVTHHYSHETLSYKEKAKGHGLTRNMMVWFWDLYYRDTRSLEPGQLTHPLSTPLAEHDLTGLPPALVLTAEHDPLRDEGIEYANRMADAGVRIQHTLYADAQHGFFGSLGPTDEHHKGIAEIAQWLGSRNQQSGNPTA